MFHVKHRSTTATIPNGSALCIHTTMTLNETACSWDFATPGFDCFCEPQRKDAERAGRYVMPSYSHS